MEQTQSPSDAPNSTVLPKTSGKSSTTTNIRCLICCEKKDKFPDRAFIQACQLCKTYLCRHCIWKMYQRATRTQSNMPPRCCVFLPLHFAIPFVSADEAEAFRSAFEEFSTPGTDRIYCPQRTCSAFIPKRLIAARAGNDKHIPGTVGTVACQKCKTEACTKCKSFVHPGHPCPPVRHDIKLEAQLLKWGYKACPYCNNWVRKLVVQTVVIMLSGKVDFYVEVPSNQHSDRKFLEVLDWELSSEIPSAHFNSLKVSKSIFRLKAIQVASRVRISWVVHLRAPLRPPIPICVSDHF